MMDTSLISFHIYGNTAPVDCDFSFRSFSPNWLSCVENLSEAEKNPDPLYLYKKFRAISRQVDAPVLQFYISDSKEISFTFIRNGKIAASYSDAEWEPNKKLFDIPSLIGYDNGQKRRLSSLLQCFDTDLRIKMLEEYFGVCLLIRPELLDKPNMLFRERSDKLYLQYYAKEKALTGKAAPMCLNPIAEYPGKLFGDAFGKVETVKPHFFLYGYTSENDYTPAPVRFTGSSLEASTFHEFEQDRIPCNHKDSRFQIDYYNTPDKITFSEECPADYRGKTMDRPRGLYPLDFLPSGELMLLKDHHIYIADHTLKIIAKLSIKGDIVDVLGSYILTTTGGSFWAYFYEPTAKINIYEVVRK